MSLGFGYDKKHTQSSSFDALKKVLRDLKYDVLKDDDVAKALKEIDYTESDDIELIALINSARAKHSKMIWVGKSTVCEQWNISQKTFERFKGQMEKEGQLELDKHYRKIDMKSTVYNVNTLNELYTAYKNASSFQKGMRKAAKLKPRK